MMTADVRKIALGGGGRSRGFWAWLRLALRVRRERRLLTRMDAASLRDLGLSRSQVEWEASRPFWDVPERK